MSYKKKEMKDAKEKGLEDTLPADLLNNLRETIIDLGKRSGDTCVEDILDNCLIELNRLKENQVKGIVVAYLLDSLPLSTQYIIVSEHMRILKPIILHDIIGGKFSEFLEM